MERTPDGRILVVADTSFLVSFLVLDRMDILDGLRAYAFRVPNHVVAEVEYEDQKVRLHTASPLLIGGPPMKQAQRASHFIRRFAGPEERSGIVCFRFWQLVPAMGCPYRCSYCFL